MPNLWWFIIEDFVSLNKKHTVLSSEVTLLIHFVIPSFYNAFVKKKVIFSADRPTFSALEEDVKARKAK